jgi:sec-independent protein translocase protein TatA
MGPLFAWFGLGPTEMLIVLIVAVLLFGKRLPEVGRSLGKGLVEFKKGIRGIEDEIDSAASHSHTQSSQRSQHDEVDDREEATAPKFEPPTSEPKAESGEPDAESAESKTESAQA